MPTDFDFLAPSLASLFNAVDFNFPPPPPPPPGNLFPFSFASSLFGGVSVTHAPFIFPTSFITTVFGTLAVLQPAFVGFNFGVPKPSPAYNSVNFNFGSIPFSLVSPAGIFTELFGAVQLVNNDTLITPAGFLAVLFGIPSVEKTSEFLYPDGFRADFFGTPSVVSLLQTIAPVGFTNFAYGNNAIIELSRRIIQTIGFLDSVDPANVVVIEVLRQLAPLSIDSVTFFGTVFVADRNKAVTVPGIFGTLFGSTTVYLAEQFIAVLGIDETVIGFPIIGDGVQFIRPLHINYASFDGNLPVVSTTAQTLQTFSIQSFVSGLATIFNRNQQIEVDTIFSFAASWVQIVVNETQFIMQLNESPLNEFGIAVVVNRNFEPKIQSFTSEAYGRPYIRNKARLLEPLGIDAFIDNLPFIAPRIRTITPVPFTSSLVYIYNQVHNTARVLGPVAIDPGIIPAPDVVDLTQQIKHHTPALGALGFPFVAFAVRTLVQYPFFVPSSFFPSPDVQLFTRRLFPAPILGGVGALVVESHQNVIGTKTFTADVYGIPSISNVTPEIQVPSFAHEFGFFGVPRLSFFTRTIALNAGIAPNIFSTRHIISDNNQLIFLPSILPPIIPLPMVTFSLPPQNSQQVITIASLPTQLGIGSPDVSIFGILSAGGIESFIAGIPTISVNTINVPLIQFVPSFGQTAIVHVSTQFISSAGGIASTVVFSEDIVFTPQHIHQNFDYAPSSIAAQCGLVDRELHGIPPSLCAPPDPWTLFGSPSVSGGVVEIEPESIFSSIVPSPMIELRRRTLLPDALVPPPLGVPTINRGGEIRPFWQIDFPEEFADLITDLSPFVFPDVFGLPSIAAVVVPEQLQTITPISFVGVVSEFLLVETKNRTVKPVPFDSAIYGIPGIEYDPRLLLPLGLTHTLFGETTIDFRVRQITDITLGDQSAFAPTRDTFDDRIRVTLVS